MSVERDMSLPLLICGVLLKRGNGGGRIQDKTSEDGEKQEVGLAEGVHQEERQVVQGPHGAFES